MLVCCYHLLFSFNRIRYLFQSFDMLAEKLYRLAEVAFMLLKPLSDDGS